MNKKTSFSKSLSAMKRVIGHTFLLLALMTTASCSKDEIIPEVKFPEGTTDFFKTRIDFDHLSDEKTITFTSNVPWTAEVADTRDGSNWCTISPSNGKAGEASLKISVNENTGYNDRNAVIRLAYGDSIKNIFVNQKQLDALTLTSNRFEVPVDGGTVDVEVKANINYKVNIPAVCKEWIREVTAPKSRELSSSKLRFIIAPSKEYAKREGEIEIISKNKKETVSIFQAGEGILSLTKKEFNISSSEQDITIEVSSNFEFGVALPEVDWISENKAGARSVSTHTIRLHVQENTSYDNRSTSLRIFDKNSSLSEEVVINQSQTNALMLDKKEFSFDENGGTFTVNLSSNVDYNVKIGDSWITETASPATRALENSSHTFTVSKMTSYPTRETKIVFTDEKTGITDEITVKQENTFYLNRSSYGLMEEETGTLVLTNKTGAEAIWKSSDEAVVTIDNNGQLKAIGRGSATITVSTTDGKHLCECHVTVKNITDYIFADNIGGSVMSNNGLILYGSSLNWKFQNYSNSTVTLKTVQLVDGQTGVTGNEMSVNETLGAYQSISFSTRIGFAGIHAPVTCKFKYEYKGKLYTTEARYY